MRAVAVTALPRARELALAAMARAPAAAHLLVLRGGGAWTVDEVANKQRLVIEGALYLATFMCTLSGVIVAGSKQMDLLGCMIVGYVTALGGGTVRDLVLDVPAFWLSRKAHLYLIFLTSIIAFLLWPTIDSTGFKDTHLAFLWSDAIGMAASAAVGARIGLVESNNWAVGVLCGLVTATFGGIGRDVLCLVPPRALYAERSMYATPALLGSACFVLLFRLSERVSLPDWVVGCFPFFLALLTRAAAWTYRLALPYWATQRSVLNPAQDKVALALKPAPRGAGDQ